jgi:hypothetical protein
MQDELTTFRSVCSYVSQLRILLIGCAQDRSIIAKIRNVRVRVTLRLVVYRQSVRLGAEPLQTHGQNCFSQLNTCGHNPYITSSLMKEWVGSYNCCWSSPLHSFSSRSPVGLAIIFYCLRFDTSFLSPPTIRRATVEVFDPASKVKVKVTLRLVVYRQSVCLGVKPLETHGQRFFPPTELLRY